MPEKDWYERQPWHAPPYVVEPTGERKRLRFGDELVYVNQYEVVEAILKALTYDEQRAILGACVGIEEPFNEALTTIRERHPELFWKNDGRISRLTVSVAMSLTQYDDAIGEADEQGFAPITSTFLGFINDPWKPEDVAV